MEKNLLPYYDGCFACSQTNPSGPQQRFSVKDGKVFSTFKPSKEFQGYENFVHGGIFSTILDESMGWAATFRFHKFCKTVKLEIRFLKETPLGKTYTIESEFVKEMRGFWEASGKVYDDEGTIYVRGVGLYYPLPYDFTRWAKDYLTYDEQTIRIFDVPEGPRQGESPLETDGEKK